LQNATLEINNKKEKKVILRVLGVSTEWHLVSSTHAVVQNDTSDAVSRPQTSPRRHQAASTCPYLIQHPAVPTPEAVSKQTEYWDHRSYWKEPQATTEFYSTAADE
jgi:hypothetical protein